MSSGRDNALDEQKRIIGDTDDNRVVIDEFRRNGGVVGGDFEGIPLLLLTTTGSKTRLPRVAPLVYLLERNRLFVFGSAAGSQKDPQWVRNIQKDSEVQVELGSDSFYAFAEFAPEPLRTDIYSIQESNRSDFAAYKDLAPRVIPVIELIRQLR